MRLHLTGGQRTECCHGLLRAGGREGESVGIFYSANME